MQERIQKIIARAGLASRRHAEEMMTAGQVTLNGKVVTELGTKADASRDHIKVNGKLLPTVTAKPLYLAMNKPPEVVATMSDPEERKSLAGFLKTIPSRVFPIGRLEYSSTGLLLLTNDGELASGIMRAHNLRQTYMLKLKGFLTLAELSKIQITTGLRLTRAKQGDNAWYEVTMADVEMWDSLRHMELIVAIEEKFGLQLEFDEISRMQSLGEIRRVVAEKTSK